MGKYFGTDGFRGEANINLTVEHAYKVGRYMIRLKMRLSYDAESMLLLALQMTMRPPKIRSWMHSRRINSIYGRG